MNPETDLMDAYQRWRHWSQVEGLAICAEDWPKVTECQQAKRELQPIILRCTDHALSGVINRAEFHQRIRPVVHELISLENHNSEILSRKKEDVSFQMEELDRSTRNLRRVQGCYATAPSAQWHSYS